MIGATVVHTVPVFSFGETRAPIVVLDCSTNRENSTTPFAALRPGHGNMQRNVLGRAESLLALFRSSPCRGFQLKALYTT